MAKKKKLIVANWKMSPANAALARVLFAKTKRVASRFENLLTVICPPFVYTSLFTHAGTSRFFLGAQDVHWSNSGRATGEVSPEMLHDLGVSYVIVGHSERRALGESDEVVSKKMNAVLKEGLKAILCVGERERDAEAHYFDFLRDQIRQSLSGVKPRFLSDLVVAYEPIWAIGKSSREAMTPRDVLESLLFVKKVLSDIYGQQAAEAVPLLYGGSAEESNTATLLKEGGADGLLVGHASLDAEGFIKMLKCANTVA